jgi:hypothetical protein
MANLRKLSVLPMVSSAPPVEESQSLTASVSLYRGSPAPQFTRCTFAAGFNRLGQSSSSPPSPTMAAVFVFFFRAAPGTNPLFFLPLTMTPKSSVHSACAFGRRPRLFLLKYCDITVFLPFFASSTLFRGFFGGGIFACLELQSRIRIAFGFQVFDCRERGSNLPGFKFMKPKTVSSLAHLKRRARENSKALGKLH